MRTLVLLSGLLVALYFVATCEAIPARSDARNGLSFAWNGADARASDTVDSPIASSAMVKDLTLHLDVSSLLGETIGRGPNPSTLDVRWDEARVNSTLALQVLPSQSATFRPSSNGSSTIEISHVGRSVRVTSRSSFVAMPTPPKELTYHLGDVTQKTTITLDSVWDEEILKDVLLISSSTSAEIRVAPEGLESLAISGSPFGDTITVRSLPSSFRAALHLEGRGGEDTIVIDHALSTGQALTVDGENFSLRKTLDGACPVNLNIAGVFTLSSPCVCTSEPISITAQRLFIDSTVSTESGDITMEAQTVRTNAGSSVSSNSGHISMTGTGGVLLGVEVSGTVMAGGELTIRGGVSGELDVGFSLATGALLVANGDTTLITGYGDTSGISLRGEIVASPAVLGSFSMHGTLTRRVGAAIVRTGLRMTEGNMTLFNVNAVIEGAVEDTDNEASTMYGMLLDNIELFLSGTASTIQFKGSAVSTTEDDVIGIALLVVSANNIDVASLSFEGEARAQGSCVAIAFESCDFEGDVQDVVITGLEGPQGATVPATLRPIISIVNTPFDLASLSSLSITAPLPFAPTDAPQAANSHLSSSVESRLKIRSATWNLGQANVTLTASNFAGQAVAEKAVHLDTFNLLAGDLTVVASGPGATDSFAIFFEGCQFDLNGSLMVDGSIPTIADTGSHATDVRQCVINCSVFSVAGRVGFVGGGTGGNSGLFLTATEIFAVGPELSELIGEASSVGTVLSSDGVEVNGPVTISTQGPLLISGTTDGGQLSSGIQITASPLTLLNSPSVTFDGTGGAPSNPAFTLPGFGVALNAPLVTNVTQFTILGTCSTSSTDASAALCASILFTSTILEASPLPATTFVFTGNVVAGNGDGIVLDAEFPFPCDVTVYGSGGPEGGDGVNVQGLVLHFLSHFLIDGVGGSGSRENNVGVVLQGQIDVDGAFGTIQGVGGTGGASGSDESGILVTGNVAMPESLEMLGIGGGGVGTSAHGVHFAASSRLTSTSGTAFVSAHLSVVGNATSDGAYGVYLEGDMDGFASASFVGESEATSTFAAGVYVSGNVSLPFNIDITGLASSSSTALGPAGIALDGCLVSASSGIISIDGDVCCLPSAPLLTSCLVSNEVAQSASGIGLVTTGLVSLVSGSETNLSGTGVQHGVLLGNALIEGVSTIDGVGFESPHLETGVLISGNVTTDGEFSIDGGVSSDDCVAVLVLGNIEAPQMDITGTSAGRLRTHGVDVSSAITVPVISIVGRVTPSGGAPVSSSIGVVLRSPAAFSGTGTVSGVVTGGDNLMVNCTGVNVPDNVTVRRLSNLVLNGSVTGTMGSNNTGVDSSVVTVAEHLANVEIVGSVIGPHSWSVGARVDTFFSNRNFVNDINIYGEAIGNTTDSIGVLVDGRPDVYFVSCSASIIGVSDSSYPVRILSPFRTAELGSVTIRGVIATSEAQPMKPAIAMAAPVTNAGPSNVTFFANTGFILVDGPFLTGPFSTNGVTTFHAPLLVEGPDAAISYVAGGSIVFEGSVNCTADTSISIESVYLDSVVSFMDDITLRESANITIGTLEVLLPDTVTMDTGATLSLQSLVSLTNDTAVMMATDSSVTFLQLTGQADLTIQGQGSVAFDSAVGAPERLLNVMIEAAVTAVASDFFVQNVEFNSPVVVNGNATIDSLFVVFFLQDVTSTTDFNVHCLFSRIESGAHLELGGRLNLAAADFRFLGSASGTVQAQTNLVALSGDADELILASGRVEVGDLFGEPGCGSATRLSATAPAEIAVNIGGSSLSPCADYDQLTLEEGDFAFINLTLLTDPVPFQRGEVYAIFTGLTSATAFANAQPGDVYDFGGIPLVLTYSASEISLVANTVPVAVSDSYFFNLPGTLTVEAPGVMDNDVDPDPGQALSAILLNEPSFGVFFLFTNGSFFFDPQGTEGAATFSYRITDGIEVSNDANVLIDVVRMPSPSATRTQSPSMSTTISVTQTPSASRTMSRSHTRTVLPSRTASPSTTPQATPSATPTQSAGAVTATPTRTRTRSTLQSQDIAPPAEFTPLPSPSPSPSRVAPSQSRSPTSSAALLPSTIRSVAPNVPPVLTPLDDGDQLVPVIDENGDEVGSVEIPPEVTGVIVVTGDDITPVVPQVVSAPLEITVIRDGNSQTDFRDSPLTVCLMTEENVDDVCLGFFNDKGDWECEDYCLKDENGKACGQTEHLTTFALLLDNEAGSDSRCGSSTPDRTLIWLSIAFIGAAIILVIIAVVIVETRVRYKRAKLGRELDRTSKAAARTLAST